MIVSILVTFLLLYDPFSKEFLQYLKVFAHTYHNECTIFNMNSSRILYDC